MVIGNMFLHPRLSKSHTAVYLNSSKRDHYPKHKTLKLTVYINYILSIYLVRNHIYPLPLEYHILSSFSFSNYILISIVSQQDILLATIDINVCITDLKSIVLYNT